MKRDKGTERREIRKIAKKWLANLEKASNKDIACVKHKWRSEKACYTSVDLMKKQLEKNLSTRGAEITFDAQLGVGGYNYIILVLRNYELEILSHKVYQEMLKDKERLEKAEEVVDTLEEKSEYIYFTRFDGNTDLKILKQIKEMYEYLEKEELLHLCD